MKKNFLKITAFKLGVIVTFLIVLLYNSDIDFINLIELKSYDLRLIQRGRVEPVAPICIIGIDDKSVKKIGRWPWPRSYISKLVDFMTDAQAKVVGFDITFAEPDLNSELMLLNDIDEHRKEWKIKDKSFDEYIKMKRILADNDLRLSQALEKNGRTILGYFFHTESSKERLDEATKEKMKLNYDMIAPSKLAGVMYTSQNAENFKFIGFDAADVNIEAISKAAKGFGYFNIFPDIDGTVRWVPLVLEYQGNQFPPLSLQILREYLRKEEEDPENFIVKVNDLGVYEVSFYDYSIPTDNSGRMLVNFRGGAYTFKYYSFYDVINGMVPKETFRDNIVLVGANSVGIYDLRVTPFSGVYPGVEVHANVIDNILNRNPMVSPDWAKGVDNIIIILIGLLLAHLIPKHRATQSALNITLLTLSYIVINYLIFVYMHIWLNLVYPLIMIATGSLVLYTYRFATEEREKKRIRGAFSHYVTESVVAEMLKNPEKLKLGGEKKDLTVLFSDIRGFTTISEGLSPSELVHLLNEYLTEMTKLVFKFEGTLDKYMGDAIMAIYGAPLNLPDHPARACNTAIEMMRKLHLMQVDWAKRNLPKIDIGIGINTGSMSAGNMGSEVRFDYTVMGDNVNLGSRLEGINKQYGTNIIISEFTHEHVKNDFICRQLDLVRVKGKKLPVKIFELLGNVRKGDWKPKNEAEAAIYAEKRRPYSKGFERLSADFEAALNKYFTKEFDESLKMLKTLEEDYPNDKAIKLFINRVQDYIANPPPPDWDGVFTMTTK